MDDIFIVGKDYYMDITKYLPFSIPSLKRAYIRLIECRTFDGKYYESGSNNTISPKHFQKYLEEISKEIKDDLKTEVFGLDTQKVYLEFEDSKKIKTITFFSSEWLNIEFEEE